MSDIDLTKIKYYPDRFYICLDGFDVDNLTSFLTDFNIGEQQSIFIHEYYHYLTNITTFVGVRQFHLNFCDRFKLITKFGSKNQLNSFPINNNNHPNCKEEIEYWNSVTDIIHDDDIDYALFEETENSQSKKFEIEKIVEEIKPMTVNVDGIKINGGRKLIKIEITGLININSFNLTFGAIDEFLSSSIDEYLFENNLSEIDYRTLSQRPFYPYQFFDKLLSHYNINRPSAFEKILLSYFALNSANPALKLIEILKDLKEEKRYQIFQKEPENFLSNYIEENNQYSDLLEKTNDFANEIFNQGRTHISQAIKYYYDKFFIARKLKEKDMFFFVRPFFVDDIDTAKGKQQFLLSLARIINLFSPPVILKDNIFRHVDKLTTFGESTTLIIATYEIFESLRTNQFAKRPTYLKNKYNFPDNDPNCDVLETFKPPPINSVFQLALNELGLYGIYLEELKKRRNISGMDST